MQEDMEQNQTSEIKKSYKKGKTNGKWVSKENRGGESAERSADTTVVDKMSEAISSASEYVAPVKDYASQINTRASEVFREYPLQAALGGLVVGFLLGAAVSRRNG